MYFSSCETVVQLELNEGDKTLVVESYLEFSDTTDAGSARVYLTESSNFYGNTSPNVVSNASILINETYVLEEDSDSLGFYVSNTPIPYLGEDNFDIDIIADIDGEEGRWIASNDFTSVPKIDSIYYVYEQAEPPFQDEGYYVKIILNDPVENRIFII